MLRDLRIFFWGIVNRRPRRRHRRRHDDIVVVINIIMSFYMSPVTRKPAFGVCDQGRLKPASAATEAW